MTPLNGIENIRDFIYEILREEIEHAASAPKDEFYQKLIEFINTHIKISFKDDPTVSDVMGIAVRFTKKLNAAQYEKLARFAKTIDWHIKSGEPDRNIFAFSPNMTAVVHVPTNVYHITPKKATKSILTKGLQPSSAGIGYRYPPRIFVSTKDDIFDFVGDLNAKKYDIFKIKSAGLTFHIDPEVGPGYGWFYTNNAISPDRMQLLSQKDKEDFIQNHYDKFKNEDDEKVVSHILTLSGSDFFDQFQQLTDSQLFELSWKLKPNDPRIDVSLVLSLPDSGNRLLFLRKMDPKLLPAFAKDENIDIRYWVAKRCDKKFLPQLINDPHEHVRLMVAQRIAPEYLPQLIKDQDKDVTTAAKKRLQKTNRLSQK